MSSGTQISLSPNHTSRLDCPLFFSLLPLRHEFSQISAPAHHQTVMRERVPSVRTAHRTDRGLTNRTSPAPCICIAAPRFCSQVPLSRTLCSASPGAPSPPAAWSQV
ncbi:hypothetical protein PV04_00449 [Phialophora macrospora]|uniref:Uncharacterized protein n=1 Tax=Phialophora macrospora TaxID=1851006 RepID=A0A0D2G0F8_9EURO|nr:hypothetical protein PV04_00449 [Phialophora macrospora]